MRIILLFIVLAIPQNSYALDIQGEWVVGSNSTKIFNLSSIGLDANERSLLKRSLLNCAINNTHWFFSADEAAFIVDEHVCQHEGQRAAIEKFFKQYKYKIIYENEKQVVLLFSRKDDEEFVEIIYRVDNNHFWINFDEGDQLIRYYFKRLN